MEVRASIQYRNITAGVSEIYGECHKLTGYFEKRGTIEGQFTLSKTARLIYYDHGIPCNVVNPGAFFNSNQILGHTWLTYH